MNPTFAEYARNDDDFAAIRDEPEFAAVMSG
jgi:hypothetical protein